MFSFGPRNKIPQVAGSSHRCSRASTVRCDLLVLLHPRQTARWSDPTPAGRYNVIHGSSSACVAELGPTDLGSIRVRPTEFGPGRLRPGDKVTDFGPDRLRPNRVFFFHIFLFSHMFFLSFFPLFFFFFFFFFCVISIAVLNPKP